MIACISIPYFVAAVERRSDEKLDRKPLAIGGQPWEAKPVYAFSQEVARRGVKSGMSLRLVQVLSPQSHFMPAEKPKYAHASGEVIDVLTDFSCLIEPQELWHSSADPKQCLTRNGRTLPARYSLDLEGLPMQDSLSLVKEMGGVLRRETRLAPAIGLAGNKFTAHVAATICRPNHILPVSSNVTAGFLSSREIDFLPLNKEASRRLHLLGVRTLGHLASLPSSTIRAQLGPEMEPLYRLAQGESEAPIEPYPMERYEQIDRQFDAPIVNFQVLTAVLHEISEQMAQRLQAAGWEGRELHLHLETEEGEQLRHTLTFRHPTANLKHLVTTLDELCAQLSLSSGVTRLSVIISDLEPGEFQQLALFREMAVSHRAHHTVQNLAAKYKTSRFYGSVLTERRHPLPERRFQLQVMAHAKGFSAA